VPRHVGQPDVKDAYLRRRLDAALQQLARAAISLAPSSQTGFSSIAASRRHYTD
jgi:hypothetical protein